jgi:hypothetical protein
MDYENGHIFLSQEEAELSGRPESFPAMDAKTHIFHIYNRIVQRLQQITELEGVDDSYNEGLIARLWSEVEELDALVNGLKQYYYLDLEILHGLKRLQEFLNQEK